MASSLGSGAARDNSESSSSHERRDAGVASSSTASPSGDLPSFPHWPRIRGQIFRAGTLWLLGFKEACQIQRVISFCRRSRPVLIKTGYCFLLNGCLFLGSLFALRRVVVPVLGWFRGPQPQLPTEIGSIGRGDLKSAGLLQTVVVGVYYVLWLYPIYISSFVVNIIWYNDIAKHAFQVLGKPGVSGQGPKAEVQSPKAQKGTANKGRSGSQPSSGIQSAVLQIGEQIYSVIMVSLFFLEVSAVSYIPYIGPLLNFVSLSWLYAYYCFDYKWGFARWSLERRLVFFETNWAFFAGFGSPCVLATYFLSPFVSAGVMNILFPLFVLVATASNPEEAVSKCTAGISSGSNKRLRIFYLANNLTVPLLRLLQPAVSNVTSSDRSAKKAQ